MEAEVDSLVVTSDSLEKFILFFCVALVSVYLEFLVFKREHFHEVHSKVSLNLRL